MKFSKIFSIHNYKFNNIFLTIFYRYHFIKVYTSCKKLLLKLLVHYSAHQNIKHLGIINKLLVQNLIFIDRNISNNILFWSIQLQMYFII